jgi:MFS family permease
LAGGLLTDWLGYGATMWIGAMVTALGGVLALILLPETRSARPKLGGPPVEEIGPRLHASRCLWVVASLHGINRFVTAGALTATMALLVQDQLSSPNLPLGVATLTGVLMAGRTLLSMAAAPLAGAASDWLGSRWGVAGWGLAIGVVSMALVAWGVPLAILAGVSLGAVAGGSVQALVTALTGDLVSQAQRGRAIGLLHTAGDFGSAIGPPAAYALMPWIGLRGVYLLCAGLFAAGLVLAMLFRPRVQGTA